jgi:hypothetical protein
MNNNNNTFNKGDIIRHKDSPDDDGKTYYYVILDRFNKYHYEYYSLFCLLQSKEVTLRMDNAHHYQRVSSV